MQVTCFLVGAVFTESKFLLVQSGPNFPWQLPHISNPHDATVDSLRDLLQQGLEAQLGFKIHPWTAAHRPALSQGYLDMDDPTMLNLHWAFMPVKATPEHQMAPKFERMEWCTVLETRKRVPPQSVQALRALLPELFSKS